MCLLQFSDTQLIIFYNNLPLLNQLQRNCFDAEFTGPLSNESSQITGAKWLFSAILYQRMPSITGSSLLSVTLSFLHSRFSLTGVQFHFYCFDSQKKNSPKTPANLDIILFNRVFTYTGVFNRSKAIHGFTQPTLHQSLQCGLQSCY